MRYEILTSQGAVSLFEIFNMTDGRAVTIHRGTDASAKGYAVALGAAYDYDSAKPGFYVERTATRTDILTACYTSRDQAQRRADMENMASDVYSFGVVAVPRSR